MRPCVVISRLKCDLCVTEEINDHLVFSLRTTQSWAEFREKSQQKERCTQRTASGSLCVCVSGLLLKAAVAANGKLCLIKL